MPSEINQIKVTIWTASGPNTGTTDNVFLGLGGREFALRKKEPYFISGNMDVFILGDAYNILNPEKNDPKYPKLTTDDLTAFPVYIRKAGTLQGDDDNAWKVERVDVDVPVFSDYIFQRLIGLEDIWLSNVSGLVLFLKRVRKLIIE